MEMITVGVSRYHWWSCRNVSYLCNSWGSCVNYTGSDNVDEDELQWWCFPGNSSKSILYCYVTAVESTVDDRCGHAECQKCRSCRRPGRSSVEMTIMTSDGDDVWVERQSEQLRTEHRKLPRQLSLLTCYRQILCIGTLRRNYVPIRHTCW